MPWLLFALSLADPTPPAIELYRAKTYNPFVVRVTGLDRDAVVAFAGSKPTAETWQTLLRVVVASGSDAETDARPVMFGTYRADGGAIVFEPRFPLEPGTPYRVTFEPEKLTKKTIAIPAVVKTLTIPRPDAPPAAVVAVYPSTDTLPENTLRMYVHFSGPMTKGSVYEHVSLRREDGTAVTRPFLELDEELWNPDGTRFTLLFDPGRIKNGLRSKDEAGPNLINGQSYTFVVSRAWQDANGRAMKETFKKKFTVGPFDATVIDPEAWKVTPPVAGGKTPLVVAFPKPLDRALLDRMIAVVGPAGTAVTGTVAVSEKETKWTYTPHAAWPFGTYRLDVDTSLEDVCGNRVGSPFEIDVFRPTTRRLETKTVSRSFVVK